MAMAVGTLAAQQQPVAITNVTIYPVSGPKIENGTIVLHLGKIVAVGRSVTFPTNARKIDGTGKIVTPGFIHAATQLGLGVGRSLGEETDEEYTAVGGTTDDAKEGQINPSFNPLEGVDPNAIAIPVARLGGVTTAIVAPGRGFLPGQALAIDLSGAKVEDMLDANPVAVVLNLSDDSREAGGGSRAGATARLRALLRDARALRLRKPEYERAAIRPLAAPAEELEALYPVLDGKVPFYVEVHRESDIANALRIAKEFNVKLIMHGVQEGWVVAGELAKARVPLVVDSRDNIPSFDGLRARYDNATLLREGGALVVLSGQDAGGQASLRFEAGHAVRNGMKWDDALAAVTIEPARAFGLAAKYGSLEVGKVANVVLWSGDPFEPKYEADAVFIRGNEMPKTSRQTELRDRYRTLPPTY